MHIFLGWGSEGVAPNLHVFTGPTRWAPSGLGLTRELGNPNPYKRSSNPYKWSSKHTYNRPLGFCFLGEKGVSINLRVNSARMDQVPMRRDEGAARIPDGCQIKSIRFYRNDGVRAVFFLRVFQKVGSPSNASILLRNTQIKYCRSLAKSGMEANFFLFYCSTKRLYHREPASAQNAFELLVNRAFWSNKNTGN